MSRRLWVPSPQQEDFQDFAWNDSRSCNLIAVAGAGKSTTIVKTVGKMRGSSAILSFNKKIADEMKAKLAAEGLDWKKAEAATCHSIGFRAYRKRFPTARVDSDKVGNITASLFEHSRMPIELMAHSATICRLVGLAKQNAIGIGNNGDIADASLYHDIAEHFDLFDDEQTLKRADEIVHWVMRILDQSNRMTEVVDFDDMVYMPVLHRVRFWQYDNVWLDEAQDTNAARRELVAALVRNRVFAVGDPCQAIYGFTGADNDSLDIIKAQFNSVEMPLTVTYRCPKVVVKFAKTWVDHIEAHESAPEGVIGFETFEQMIADRTRLGSDAAILCRNTRPLVSAAFSLIREKIPCRIEGREIGESLKKLAIRWHSIGTIPELDDKLEEWQDREIAKAIARKKMQKIQEIEDKVETLRVIMARCLEEKKPLITHVVAYIEEIFADNVSGVLTLATIHRSKGREWKRVFWLDRHNTCPSRYATQPWEKQQESNLCYVAATRSMGELIDVTLPMPVAKVPPANENTKPQQTAVA
jgi:superfamily I DNA/RNA helicase